jgi:hypothetical protein
MMGLEPTTFCMASASDRSQPFAPLRLHRPFAGSSCSVRERALTRANAECCHCCHCARCHEKVNEPYRPGECVWVKTKNRDHWRYEIERGGALKLSRPGQFV